jgi:hypothetical protein
VLGAHLSRAHQQKKRKVTKLRRDFAVCEITSSQLSHTMAMESYKMLEKMNLVGCGYVWDMTLGTFVHACTHT